MKLTKSSIALAAIAGWLTLSLSAEAQTNGSARSTPPAGPHGGGGLIVESQMNFLSEKLHLTAEQKPKVKAVLEQRNKEGRELRDLPNEERRSKIEALRVEMDKKMKAILTSEQYKEYQQMRSSGPHGGQGAGAGGGGGGGGGK